jgi:integrase/recombinase XerD
MLVELETFLATQNKSKNTIDGYIRAIKDFFTWFSQTYNKEPQKLMKLNVDEFRSFLQTVKRQDAKTINYKLSALKKYNEFLVDRGIQSDIVITKNMMIKVQQDYASPATISEKEVNQLRQTILENGSVRDLTLVNLLAYTGVRISEALSIRVADCNAIFQTHELIIRNGKGNKQRTVYPNDKILNSLRDYLNERSKFKTASESDFLFVSNKNPQLDRITVNKMLTNYCKIAKIPNITPHQLRHFFCSNALEKGFTVAEVASIAGHSNIHTTLIYTNPSRKKMIEKVNSL